MNTTYDEILDILDKWQHLLGERPGRELWIDKPTSVQEEDLTNFNCDLEAVRSFIMSRDICTCDECKFLKVKNDGEVYAVCEKTGYIFEQFETDTREHFCAFGERKEEDGDE